MQSGERQFQRPQDLLDFSQLLRPSQHFNHASGFNRRRRSKIRDRSLESVGCALDELRIARRQRFAQLFEHTWILG